MNNDFWGHSWGHLPMIFTRDFITRENLWQITPLLTQKSLFMVTHALFFIYYNSVQFQYKDHLFRYKDFHYKDNTVMRPYGPSHQSAALLLPGFYYQLIAKPGNKTAIPSWSHPYYLYEAVWPYSSGVCHLLPNRLWVAWVSRFKCPYI